MLSLLNPPLNPQNRHFQNHWAELGQPETMYDGKWIKKWKDDRKSSLCIAAQPILVLSYLMYIFLLIFVRGNLCSKSAIDTGVSADKLSKLITATTVHPSDLVSVWLNCTTMHGRILSAWSFRILHFVLCCVCYFQQRQKNHPHMNQEYPSSPPAPATTNQADRFGRRSVDGPCCKN